MERQEIIDLLLKKRIQIDSASLEELCKNQSKVWEILKKIDNGGIVPKTITAETIRSLLFGATANIELVKKPVCKKNNIMPKDYVEYFSNRYEEISKLLVKKLSLLNLVSLGKITQKTKNFSVIGMVKEKNNGESAITIEDHTGDLTIYFDEKTLKEFGEIVLDEVLGVICEKNEVVRAKKIVSPDVDLQKNVNKTKDDVFCLFISDLHMDEKKTRKSSYEKFLDWINRVKYSPFYIFVLGDVSSEKENITNFFNTLPKDAFKVFIKGEADTNTDIWDLTLPDPSFIRIESNVLAFLSHGEFLTNYTNIWKELSPAAVIQCLLKKRHIHPVFELNSKIYESDPFLFDLVPDIFVSGHTHIPSLLNYKGVSIMTTGSFVSTPVFWLTNLRTRENIKLDFT